MTELWVGCFTDDDGRDGLLQFDLSGSAPALRHSTTLRSPAWLVGTDFGAFAVQHLAESGVSAVTGAGAGEPVAVGPMSRTHGADACHGALNPSRTVLAVAQYSSGSVAFVPVNGADLGTVVVLAFEGHSGVNPDRQEAPHAHQVCWLDDEHVLVADLGADLVRVVRFSDGTATQTGQIPTPAGFGPRHLVLRTRSEAPGWAQIAVCGELTGNVASYQHEGTDWSTNWTRIAEVPGTSIGGSQPSGLRALGDDRLALANRAVNTIAILQWDADGQLHLLEEFDCGGEHPRDLVVVGPDIWVANQESDNVCHFDADPQLVSSTHAAKPAALLVR